MRSATLKWIVLLSTLVVALIIIVQLYWLNKIYSLEQKQFDTNIVKSVRGLFEDITLTDGPGLNLKTRIEHPDQNTFLVQIDKVPSGDSLLSYITGEFDDFGVLADCRISIYSAKTNRTVYSHYL